MPLALLFCLLIGEAGVALDDFSAVLNLAGVMLVLIFTIRWGGRPGRNMLVGNIGFAMIFVAAASHLALWASGRLAS